MSNGNRIVYNRSKIVATVGPASSDKQTLRELILAGTDCFRLNFSHGTHGDHLKIVKYIRELNKELNTQVCTLQDLQGPKIRIGEVKKGERIKAGDKLVITTKEMEGDANMVSTTYQNLPADVEIDDLILVDDGKLELIVEKVEDHNVVTRVVHGGKLKSRKGMNLPRTRISAPCLTEKDEQDLEFGIKEGMEWIALSFVREAKDIHVLREKIKKSDKPIKIIAKIERPEAIENIDEIIEATDGIMIARGDLGVEIPLEQVPMFQKKIVRKCNNNSKPVIIATQMMESMIENPRPTRAEANDVANAVMDGADALMLSGETAVGEYPIQVVKIMVKTITNVELSESIYHNHYMLEENDPLFYNNTLVLTACQLAKTANAKAIIGMTESGYLAQKLASHRPKSAIFVFTHNKDILNTLNLMWGVRAYYYDKDESTDQTLADIEQILKSEGHISKGDVFINTASIPIEEKLRTNMIKITVAQ